jgi:hypothetical protein
LNAENEPFEPSLFSGPDSAPANELPGALTFGWDLVRRWETTSNASATAMATTWGSFRAFMFDTGVFVRAVYRHENRGRIRTVNVSLADNPAVS